MKCDLCFHACELSEGQTGFCRARTNRGGRNIPGNHHRWTAVALDPIEKKPLARFHPGSMILSVGSFGCNLRCPFCQNASISMTDQAPTKTLSPEELVQLAERYRGSGNIGIAFTYNEPLLDFESIIETGRLLHEHDMVCVLVSNGCFSQKVLRAIAPYVDAMNIDLKGFTDSYYDWCQGDLNMVKDWITHVTCHLEVTTLIVPGKNDSPERMAAEAAWLASVNENIVLHVTRYFPRYHCDIPAAPVRQIYELADVARRYLKYVYTGNC